VDPINPGAVDEVLNLGECWNEDGFKESRNNIIEINKQVGKKFKRAYKFIGAAKLIHDDWCSYYNDSINYSQLNILSEHLKEKIFTKQIGELGLDRHLFATAFTPAGIITFIEDLCSGYDNIYVLNGPPNIGKHKILEYLLQEGLKRGYYMEVFHTPLNPNKIEHIIIPEANCAVITSNEINKKGYKGTQINLKSLINDQSIHYYKNQIEESEKEFYNLLNKGLNNITEAKKLHDKLEKYYIPNMNFSLLDNVYDKMISKIEKYE